jgi:hypothetical protein
MTMWLGVLWLVAGAVMAAIGWLGMNSRLKRGHWAGIRLPSTLVSEDAWAAGHEDGSRWLAGGGGLVATIGVLILVFKPDEATTASISIVLAFFMVVTVAGAATAAHRAATKVTAQAAGN